MRVRWLLMLTEEVLAERERAYRLAVEALRRMNICNRMLAGSNILNEAVHYRERYHSHRRVYINTLTAAARVTT